MNEHKKSIHWSTVHMWIIYKWVWHTRMHWSKWVLKVHIKHSNKIIKILHSNYFANSSTSTVHHNPYIVDVFRPFGFLSSVWNKNNVCIVRICQCAVFGMLAIVQSHRCNNNILTGFYTFEWWIIVPVWFVWFSFELLVLCWLFIYISELLLSPMVCPTQFHRSHSFR